MLILKQKTLSSWKRVEKGNGCWEVECGVTESLEILCSKEKK